MFLKNSYVLKINFAIISFFLLCLPNIYSQKILWEKSYGGLQSEYLFDAIPTPDYGFILAGSSLSGKSGNKKDEGIKDLDFWVWKMDEHGDLDWQKSFGGNGTDLLQNIDLTLDGGFILGGTSTSSKSGVKSEKKRGQEDIWVIKLNAKGDMQWQRTLGGVGRDELKQIIAIKSGGYIIGGSSNSQPIISDKNNTGEKKSEKFGNMDYWIVKLDSEGEIEWEKTFGGIYKDELQSLIQTKDGGYLAGGTSNSPISGNKKESNYGQGDYWVIKLDKNGEEEWQRTIGGDKDDRLSTLIETRDGNYILGGSSSSEAVGRKYESNGEGSDFWIVALNENGKIIWQKSFDFGENDVLTSLVENEDGSLFIGGHIQNEYSTNKKTNTPGINDYIALKISPDGEELWKVIVGSEGIDILRKAIETHDGGYLLSGISSGKISRDRNSGHGRFDFWVVKLKDEEKEEKEGIPALKAWPNPTNAYTNVIVNHDFNHAEVSVYDILGRRIQYFKADQRTIPVDLEAQSEGVYIIEVKTDIKKQTVKVIRGLR